MFKLDAGRGVRVLRSVLLAVTVAAGGTVAVRAETTATAATVSSKFASEWSSEALASINPDVFDLAMRAATCAVKSGDVENPATLTVIDYSKPSTEKRLWVFDLRAR
jgi:hypothetical protein